MDSIGREYPDTAQAVAICASTWRRAQTSAVDREVTILTKRAAEQYTLGVVYSPLDVDSQGEYADADTIRKAAHEFYSRAHLSDQHTAWDASLGRIVESYLAPIDMAINGQLVKAGTWLLGVQWSDDAWRKIQQGERIGLSMGGRAEREMVA